MAAAVRLIVTENSTAARTMADQLAESKVRCVPVHRVDVFETVTAAGPTRVIGLGGLLTTPQGDPPTWLPARRAPANALRVLARDTESLILAIGDPLMAVQARDVACEGRPMLLRATRVGTPPFTRLRHPDDLSAEAQATQLEIDALVSAHLGDLDPGLGHRDLAALGVAGTTAVSHAVLRRAGIATAQIQRLAERGYLVGTPARRSPAGELLAQTVAPPLLDRRFSDDVTAWIDAVRRGTLSRQAAIDRTTRVLDSCPRPNRPDDLDAGRLIGTCPECGDWMGGARKRITCLGCGMGFSLPRNVEALAVPGASCSICDAPMIVPVVHGRRDDARCADRAGCPSNLAGVRVATS